LGEAEQKINNKERGDIFDENGWVKAESMSSGKSVIIKYYSNGVTKYKLLSEYYSEIKNQTDPKYLKPVLNALGFYAGSPSGIAQKYPELIFSIKERQPTDQFDPGAIAFYRTSTSTISLSINMPQKELSSELNNKWLFVNALIHESVHHEHFKANKNDNEKTGNVDEKREGAKNHADVYFEMIQHSSFDKVPKSTKLAILDMFVSLLNDSNYNLSDEQQNVNWLSYKNKYNTVIKNKFGDELYKSENGSGIVINRPFRITCN
jgi:hypothetical protein